MCFGKYVCHAEELTSVFQPDVSAVNATYTEGEVTLSRTIQSYWTQFAKIGEPGNGGNSNPTKNMPWSPFVQSPPGSETSIKFEVDDVKLQNEVDLDRSKCEFWDKLKYSWIR